MVGAPVGVLIMSEPLLDGLGDGAMEGVWVEEGTEEGWEEAWDDGWELSDGSAVCEGTCGRTTGALAKGEGCEMGCEMDTVRAEEVPDDSFEWPENTENAVCQDVGRALRPRCELVETDLWVGVFDGRLVLESRSRLASAGERKRLIAFMVDVVWGRDEECVFTRRRPRCASVAIQGSRSDGSQRVSGNKQPVLCGVVGVGGGRGFVACQGRETMGVRRRAQLIERTRPNNKISRWCVCVGLL